MQTITLNWSGPFAFNDLVTTRERYAEFAGPGVYVHLRRHADGPPDYIYVGRAGVRPDLMQRQVRHYVGRVGLLYYLEPKLIGKRTSQADFEKATGLLRDRARFREQMEKEFQYMDSLLVYLATCGQAEAADAEAALIGELKSNTRKEVGVPVTLVHVPAAPGTE